MSSGANEMQGWPGRDGPGKGQAPDILGVMGRQTGCKDGPGETALAMPGQGAWHPLGRGRLSMTEGA